VGHYRDRDSHPGGGADLGHIHEAIQEEAIDEESWRLRPAGLLTIH
jgi:hypothetical protein